MRLVFLLPLALAVALAPAPAAAVKKAPYPEIKVEALAPYTPDAAFDAMRKKLADAVTKKDLAALTALVAPNFAWTAASEPTEEFDSKRDAVHNFKVAFGFRPHGNDADGPTDVGPLWDLLALYAAEPTLAQEPNSPNVCAPSTAKVIDPGALKQAMEKVESDDEVAEWVYFIEEITLTATPAGRAPAGKVAKTALPLVGVHPVPGQGQSSAASQTPTHVELLMPSGKTGWAEITAVRPLLFDRLCFAKSAGGDWMIAAFDQAE